MSRVADSIPPGLAPLFGLFAPWRSQAACRGLGVERFFVERGPGTDSSGNGAKRVCASCPVFYECIESSVALDEEYGIWGGAGEAERRWLRRAWLKRPHGPEAPRGCRCDWCERLERHVAVLDGVEVEVPNRIGRGATHGRRSTQAKGCRCAACVWAASVFGQLAARLRRDTPTVWAEAAPVGASDAERRVAADRVVEQLLTETVVSLVVLAGGDGVWAGAECRRWLAARRQARERVAGPASEDHSGQPRTMAA